MTSSDLSTTGEPASQRFDSTLSDALTVVVQVPVTASLVDTTKRFKTWLKNEKIQPRDFKIATRNGSFSTVTIAFGTVEDAERFRNMLADCG